MKFVLFAVLYGLSHCLVWRLGYLRGRDELWEMAEAYARNFRAERERLRRALKDIVERHVLAANSLDMHTEEVRIWEIASGIASAALLGAPKAQEGK